MREILFKGKRTDTGEWVEGYFYHPIGNWVRLAYKREPYMIARYEKDFMPPVEVFPETVGQYVGITDINGKKIFEGDIVQSNTYEPGDEVGVVVYDDKKCTFGVRSDEFGWWLWLDETIDGWEIIGNIHDKRLK